MVDIPLYFDGFKDIMCKSCSPQVSKRWFSMSHRPAFTQEKPMVCKAIPPIKSLFPSKTGLPNNPGDCIHHGLTSISCSDYQKVRKPFRKYRHSLAAKTDFLRLAATNICTEIASRKPREEPLAIPKTAVFWGTIKLWDTHCCGIATTVIFPA